MATKARPTLDREAIQKEIDGKDDCVTARFLRDLPLESRRDVEWALSLDSRELSTPRLLELLMQNGFENIPSLASLKAHRGNKCICKRKANK